MDEKEEEDANGDEDKDEDQNEEGNVDEVIYQSGTARRPKQPESSRGRRTHGSISRSSRLGHQSTSTPFKKNNRLSFL